MNNAIESYKNTAGEIDAWGCEVTAQFAPIARHAAVDTCLAVVQCDGVAMGAFEFYWDARTNHPVAVCRRSPAGTPALVLSSLCAHIAAHVRAENEAQTAGRRSA